MSSYLIIFSSITEIISRIFVVIKCALELYSFVIISV